MKTITDKYGMTNEELLERYSNLSVDDYKGLLAEVKRLRQGIIDVMIKSGHYDSSDDWMKALNKVIE